MIATISQEDFANWWSSCLASYNAKPVVERVNYKIGEEVLLVNFYQEDNSFFHEAIAHNLINNSIEIDFQIDVIDAAKSGISFNLDLIKQYHYKLATNHFAKSEDGRFVLYYQLEENYVNLQLVDKQSQRAICWFTDVGGIPAWEKSFPFRQILSVFYENSDYCMIHGAGVAFAGFGVIITAKGGSGKSTAALACLAGDCDYVGDDFILYNLKTKYMYSLYNVAKLEFHQLGLFSDFNDILVASNTDMQKQQLFLYPKFANKLTNKVKVKAVLVPKFDAELEESNLEHSSVSLSVISMAPTTIFLLKAGKELFAKLTTVCQELPNYRLNTSKNIQSINRVVMEFLSEN
ncbi:MAG: hypothetical protein KAZ94_03460 [Burkholderiales bacterium]|jgi:hypothetical protein|nr:hypothetical protein [Burkholderiales bacterium]